MNERDELFELREIARAVLNQDIQMPQELWAEQIALAVKDAGYSKPRTITTAEELDALPSGSVILDSEGEPNVLHDNGWVLPGGGGGYTTWAVAQSLPATVLWEPR